MSDNSPELVGYITEILKPIGSFIGWAIAVTGISIKIYEIIRWFAEKREKPKQVDVLAEVYREIGEIRGITWRYRRRLKKVDTNTLLKDMRQVNQIDTELNTKIKNLTGKNLFDVLKDPPQEVPKLPSDEMLKEVPLLELVIKEEMKNIGNIAMRTQRQIKKFLPHPPLCHP